MIRHLSLPLPPTADNHGATGVRLLAISDERAPTLDYEANRDQIGRLDAVVGCGDLEPDYLAFISDAFNAPLLYVRGNHDRDGGWVVGRQQLPDPIEGRLERINGVTFAGLSWPGRDRGRAERDGTAAWWQSASTVVKARLRRNPPQVVISHVPPRGLGDDVEDDFHRGFSAYRWLCRRLQPVLWLHGHTSLSSAADWRTTWGGTTLVNVTGGVLIDLRPRG